MNPYQRTLAAIRGEKYDSTPVIPHIIQHALHIARIPHSIYSSNGKKLAEAQITSLKAYGYDGFTVTTDNQIIAEAMGCIMKLPYDEPPQYVHRILSNKEDPGILKDFDPFTDARMPVILEATKTAREILGDEYFIKVNFDSAPFSIAAYLMGEERFFTEMYDDEAYVYDLLEICTKAVIKYVKAIISVGAHGVTCGDSLGALVGRDLYKKYVLPYEIEVFRQIKETGVPSFLHICGDTHDILDLMAEVPADVLEIDSDVPFAEAYEMTGRRVCLQGNVPTIEVMLQGTPEDVSGAANECMDASQGRMLILGTGCEVPRGTPPENVAALVEAARSYKL